MANSITSVGSRPDAEHQLILSRRRRRFSRQSFLPESLCITQLKHCFTNQVLLTFDDGPHPETTSAVLDRLKEYRAKAVFFVVGDRIHRAPEMLLRILDEGHLLGNHSHSHPLGKQLPLRKYMDDLRRCQDEIFEISGYLPKLFRPPLGVVSFASMIAPKKLGLSSMLWSYSSEDWRFSHCWDPMAASRERAAIMSTEICPRDIVLFHDEQLCTVQLLDMLIPILLDRGLELNLIDQETFFDSAVCPWMIN